MIKGDLAYGVDLFGLAVMDLVWCHEIDAGMVVILIVPVEEVAAEGSGSMQPKRFGNCGWYFRVLK